MEDHEIIAMALFKLHECGVRITTLAGECISPEVRDTLMLLAEELAEQEYRMRALSKGKADRRSPRGQLVPVASMPRVKRRAVAE